MPLYPLLPQSLVEHRRLRCRLLEQPLVTEEPLEEEVHCSLSRVGGELLLPVSESFAIVNSPLQAFRPPLQSSVVPRRRLPECPQKQLPLLGPRSVSAYSVPLSDVG